MRLRPGGGPHRALPVAALLALAAAPAWQRGFEDRSSSSGPELLLLLRRRQRLRRLEGLVGEGREVPVGREAVGAERELAGSGGFDFKLARLGGGPRGCRC